MSTTVAAPRRQPTLGAPLHEALSELRPLLQRAITRSWPDAPLSPSQARLLRTVRLCPGISPLRAASEVREDATFVATLTRELVALELLEVRTPPSGGDAELRLTARGRVRTVAWNNKEREMLDRALDVLSAAERAAIALALPALERLALALDGC